MTRLKQRLLPMTAAASLTLFGCADDSSNGGNAAVTASNFDFVRFFANYADSIIYPNYQAIAQSANQLIDSNGPIANYCNAIGTANESSRLTSAQTAWRELNSAIQRAELHKLGPVTENNSALGLRLNNFGNSALSTCGIDQSVVLADEDSSFTVASRTTNQRSINTLEYLLFNTDLSHTCPAQITQTANWNARPADERKLLRCEYAQLIAADLADAANSLANAWDINGGNFRSRFADPNNAADNLSALSDALFYLDVDVKDSKLGVPTGIDTDCASFSCPDAVENPYSETSLANIKTNLQAFADMLDGNGGLGFDDIITQAGASDLNTQFTDKINAAITAIDAISTSLKTDVSAIDDASKETSCTNAAANPDTASPFPSCNLFGLIKRITDDLKIGFVAAVNVDLPDRAQSDND